MVALTLRGVKGSPLTHQEMDDNLTALDAGLQPLDGDLTTIAALTAATDSFMQAKAGAWAARTVAQVKTDLGLIGSNSGDQTITLTGMVTGSGTGSFATSLGSFTKAQLDAAISDGNVLYVGDLTQYTDEAAQDAVGAMVDASLVYVDATPLLQRAALTGDVTAAAGSNATTIAAGVVTLAKQADVATARIMGRTTAGTGVQEALTAAQAKAVLAIANTDVSGLGTLSTQSGTFSGTSSGTNTGDQSAFLTIAVAGQSDVVADTASDTLTLVAGSNVTITTNAATDTITIAASGAGGGATYGTATIDFGAAPGSNEASVTFADAAIGAAAKVEVFIMAADTTADHTANDHKYAGQLFSLSASPTAGVGGTIYGRSIHKMQGTFAVRWKWAA